MFVIHRFALAAAVFVCAGAGVASADPPDPSPAPAANVTTTTLQDTLRKHFSLSISPTASFSVGAGDGASLLRPINSAIGASYGVAYKNSWSDGNQTFRIRFKHGFANDVDPHVLTTLKNAFDLEAINAQTEYIGVEREWDSAATGAEQLSVALGNKYRHAGPSIVQQAQFSPTRGYHLTTLTPDYFFGPLYVQGPNGVTRRWDLAISVMSGSHRSAADPATGATDVASKLTYEVSPTYSFPLNRSGSVFGALSYSNDVRYFDGLRKPVHFNDYDLGVSWVPNAHVTYEIHLNSLTRNNPDQALSAPASLSHANIDFKLTVAGLP